VSEPSDEDPPLELPPEGTSCREHPEVGAVVICPRCARPVCLSCWHDPIRRCHECLLADPTAAGPAIPWEDDRRSLPARFMLTLGSAFSPSRSAPGLGRGGVGPALTFALLSFVPISLASGIIPYTGTLLFEPFFAFRTIGTPSDAEIALDVGKAAGLGLLVWAVQAIVLGTAYASLVRAYLGKGNPAAAPRAVLYRAWLLPTTMLWMHLGGLVTSELELAATLELIGVVPLMLLVAAMIATARMGAGIGRMTSFVVVLIPIVVMLLAQAFLGRALEPLLPDSAAIAAAARAAAATP
jgi:hypothetical protein